jgi:catechol 2,3-dioxygenase-like lactoylglutathione lyase family enzyme
LKGVLSHIEIYVSDLRKSLEFWDWLLSYLGYEKFQQWEQGASFKLNDTYLVFVQVEEKYKSLGYHRKQVGLNHLAFFGGTRKAIDDLTLKLKAKGISVLYEDKQPFAAGGGYYAVLFEDPDRIKVEVVAK